MYKRFVWVSQEFSMNIQSRLGRIVFSQLAAWIAVFIVGSYLMMSFDKKLLNQPAEPGVFGAVKHYYKALKFQYVKKGIDLEGGTYLVLNVVVEKAIENRLALEGRSLENLFKGKLKVLPTKREVNNMTLDMIFPDENAAKTALTVARDARAQILQFKVVDNVLKGTLTSEYERTLRVGAIEQGVSVLTNRLGGYGVESIVVQAHGDHQIVVQIPGVEEPEHIKSVITKTAHLTFRVVEDTGASKEVLLDKFDGDLPSDKMIVPGKTDGDEPGMWYLVSAYADLTGEHITSAKVDHDEYNRAVVSLKFDSIGAREFAEITSNNIDKHLGIIMDDVLISDPVIKVAITGGSAQISNIASTNEAVDLSIVLKSGSLSAPLEIDREDRVGASLGEDSIRSGIMSCLIALLLLLIFSLLYYRIPGLLAMIALLCNLFLTMLFLSYFRATLTLPGIGGLVLTIGMAIDASILIYERVKEDLHMGTPLRKSVLDSFRGVMAIILDSNITTFLTGLILFQFGGPAIRGFAVTLMLGIIATLLSGIFFLKAIYLFLFDNTPIKKLRF